MYFPTIILLASLSITASTVNKVMVGSKVNNFAVLCHKRGDVNASVGEKPRVFLNCSTMQESESIEATEVTGNPIGELTIVGNPGDRDVGVYLWGQENKTLHYEITVYSNLTEDYYKYTVINWFESFFSKNKLFKVIFNFRIFL